MVPQEKYIPNHNFKNTIIVSRRNSFSKSSIKNRSLKTLYNYLKNQSKYSTKKLNIISNVNQIISLSNNWFLILDKFDNKLIEYNILTDSLIHIAGFGRGPGELNFSKDMVKDGNNIYVAQNMQVSHFNCLKVPCKYSSATELTNMPYSLDVNEDSLIYLSSKIVKGIKGPKLDKSLNDLKALHMLNLINGKDLGYFGDTYKINGQWMLIKPLISNGFVRFIPKSKSTLLAFKRFPLIYIYNNNHKLSKVYKLSNFITGKQKYNTISGSLHAVMKNYSLIKNIIILNNMIIIKTLTVKNEHISNHHYVSDSRLYDFYVININNNKNYHIGELVLDKKDPYENIFYTKKNIFIYNNGSLFTVNKW
ncbi:MAG TPA: hypothetical protein VJ991_11250 [Balneolales bacterium]|nr:hypothetical protein [Balneolales bacterium]HYX09332.1 hypothetical protein [Bacteroidales bacterium]